MNKRTFGKIPPLENKKGIVIVIPVIIIDPNEEVEVPLPRRPKVYKTPTEDTTTIYCHMADSIMSSNNNADSDPDGLIIKR